ncbi:hypothetical protein F2P56_004654 [Juglans regia]|uniref:Cellulose synthase-like protein G3 n=2 Tax=Juglans regia TaxID=51240 RepID=A0A833Y4S9_JUGRE|nr:cellulose synthase-like protein G3 isoform X1 [Juglans regia]KAF5478064.1 hypothetical protein F2P56_004654 [Juglans regia]
MEAAKFATHWLPFCRKNNVVDRSPESYFARNNSPNFEAEKMIKTMYDNMKIKVDNVVERGKVGDEYMTGEEELRAFNKWTEGFTRQDHPTVIQVLLENRKDKDITGHLMPNLIYVSRQKSRISPHHFKAGALNALLRVSATMTNAPIILTLDCDMYSNDPRTPLRVLCYLLNSSSTSTQAQLDRSTEVGYIQFPQHFHGINKNDTYACEYKRLFQINSVGFDGLAGPNHVGTGCFFCRRAFFGGPSTFVPPEIPELGPFHVVDKPIRSQPILELAHVVASCNYENQTKWGFEIGVRYGSLVEDYFTGYRLHCEGWKSIFCSPKGAAFLGDAPITLVDVLNQQKRWSIGLLDVVFSKFSQVTFGIRSIGLLMAIAYAQVGFWSFWSIPITMYAFLPQLALLKGISIFPSIKLEWRMCSRNRVFLIFIDFYLFDIFKVKNMLQVSESWFLLYMFLFLGAYLQDLLDFLFYGGTVQRWWSDQRMWNIRGLTCYLFGFVEFFLKSVGIPTQGFNVTSKVLDDEQSKRYMQGFFEFGVPSPMFVPLTTAAFVNLVSFVWGLVWIFRGSKVEVEGLFVQIFLAGFGVVNSWPIYEGVVWRRDKGKLHIRTTMISTFLASLLVAAASFAAS